MADEWFKVGSTFTVTCDTRDPRTGASLITLTNYSGHKVYAKRPDNRVFILDIDSVTADVLVATVTPTQNPLTGTGKWANGYAGNWEFYPYCVGSGSITFHGKEAILVVHPQWRNP